LQKAGLPVLATPADVARALEIPVTRLRWLAFHSDAAERPHYTYFRIPKKSGGERLLSAPHRELEKAQRWIFEKVLSKIATEKGAHGFVAGRSTVTNAVPHKGQSIILNLDLKDFFPSITFPRVRGLFESFGYSPAVATVLALLTTESPRVEATLDGKTYFVAAAERGLPQGACTSPALSNIVCRKLDRRLTGLCRKRGFLYTRYADDLTFSAGKDKDSEVGRFLASVRHVLDEEGFRINQKKFRLQRSSSRQTVTGIVVNRKLSVPREEIRRVRAILHQARTAGLAAQNRENRPNFESWLEGKIAYIAMVDHAKGVALKAEFERVRLTGFPRPA
jgi:retron-type reverse transcriptase